jgi:hypothetical protein
LIAISHAVTALTKTRLSGAATAARACSSSLAGADTDQMNT